MADTSLRFWLRGVGLLSLLCGLLLTSLFVAATPVSQSAQIPQENMIPFEVAAVPQFDMPGNAHETADLKRLKINLILSKFKTGLHPESKDQLANLIYLESQEYNYDPELILALVITESSFYNWSKSRVGALGLMQILPTTGREVARVKNIPWRGKKTLYDPHLNIKLGTHYLSELHNRFGEIEVALTAYNYGPTRVAEMQKRCDRLPKVYSTRILNLYKRFLEMETIELAQSWDPNELNTLLEEIKMDAVRI